MTIKNQKKKKNTRTLFNFEISILIFITEKCSGFGTLKFVMSAALPTICKNIPNYVLF